MYVTCRFMKTWHRKVPQTNHRRFSHGLPLCRSCFLAAKEIIFTRNATEAINLVARTWGAANISLLGGWFFVCTQKNGEEKNVEDLRLSQGLVMRFCSPLWTGKTWGPTIWMFQHLQFWILESFDHFNQVCLKGLQIYLCILHFWLARNIIPIWCHGNS